MVLEQLEDEALKCGQIAAVGLDAVGHGGLEAGQAGALRERFEGPVVGRQVAGEGVRPDGLEQAVVAHQIELAHLGGRLRGLLPERRKGALVILRGLAAVVVARETLLAEALCDEAGDGSVVVAGLSERYDEGTALGRVEFCIAARVLSGHDVDEIRLGDNIDLRLGYGSI